MIPLSVLTPKPHPLASKLDAIYSRLPNLDCKMLCAHSCGPIGLIRAERSRIKHELGSLPEGFGDINFGKEALKGVDYSCKLLIGQMCSIHPIRPLICRLWGSMESMRCPHGCVPDRWVSQDEFRELTAEIAGLTGRK